MAAIRTGHAERSPRDWHHLFCALIAIATALVYAPTVRFPYVYEDTNFHTDLLRAWPGVFPAGTLTHPDRWLTRLSFDLTHVISRTPAADHLVNVSLHLLNLGLLWFVIAPVLSVPASLIAMTLWALHPIQTEAVAYVSGRPDLLVATGILCACLGVSKQRISLVCLGAIGASLSKETGLMALPLAGLWAWQSGRPMPKRWWVLGGAASGLLGVGIARQFGLAGVAGLDEVSAHLAMLWRLLGYLAWPVGLSIDHDWSWVSPTIGGFAFLAWLVVWWWAWTHPRSWSGFAGLWVTVALLPRLLAHDPEPLHEHHLYVPLVGLSLSAALLALRWEDYGRRMKCLFVGHFHWLLEDGTDRHSRLCSRCRRYDYADGGYTHVST